MHTFGASNTPGGTNGDGAQPESQLLLIGSSLYGTASNGGTNESDGTVFSINTNGSDFRVVYTFGAVFNNNTEPWRDLSGWWTRILNNTVYGATVDGGANTQGNVYSLNLRYSFGGPNEWQQPRVEMDKLGLLPLFGARAERRLYQRARRDKSLYECYWRPAGILPIAGELELSTNYAACGCPREIRSTSRSKNWQVFADPEKDCFVQRLAVK